MIKKLLFLLIIFLLFAIPAAADTNVSGDHINWKGTNWWFSHYDRTDPTNCWIDNNGDLHMVLRRIGGVYKGVMLEAPTTCRYGRITWVAKSNSLNFERKSSIGLFTYYTDASELDIEINQWYANDWHLFYSKQPASIDSHPENLSYGVPYNSPYLAATNITYVIEWTPKYILYNAYLGDGTVLHTWNYTTVGGIPAVNHTICMDLLALDNGPGPDSGNPLELILSDYRYDAMRPVAAFSASSATGTTDTVFSFSDTSTGIPKNWAWTFGDGTTSSAQNPTHTYSSPGTYTVTLTAWNAVSSDVETKTSYIVVSEGVDPVPPVAGFAANVTSGNNPLTVAFEDQTSNTPTSWDWDFGDGSANSILQNPTHTYSADGVYTVALTATNAVGGDTETKSGYITVSTVPGTTISPYENYLSNYNFETWSGGTEDVAPDGWEISGTGAEQTGGARSPDAAIGTYSYSITGDGETAAKGHIVQYTGITSAPSKFSAWVKKGMSATGGVEFYIWNGAENYKTVYGNEISENVWTHYEWSLAHSVTTSAAVDLYSVLTATGTWYVDGISISNTTSITGETETATSSAIYSNFSYTPSQVFEYGSLVTEYVSYNLSAYDVSSVTAFVDGSEVDTHYKDNYVYIDTSGLSAEAHTIGIVAELGEDLSPVADFSANVTWGVAPVTVGFTDESTNTPTSWYWTFGDGTDSTDQNPTHTYSTAGTYGVSLTAMNEDGSGSESRSSYITVVTGPTTVGQWIYYIFSFRWW